MKVLVLAAGRSKRMKPIEDKNFLNFLGQPLIKWQLSMLWECGFKDVILVGGAHNLSRLKALDDEMPIKIDVVEQKNLNEGMKGAVLASEKLIGNEPLLVFSSNDVVDIGAFESILDAVKENEKCKDKVRADGFVLAKKVEEYFTGGYLQLDGGGFIKKIVEKPEPGKEPSDLINIVVHYFKNPKVLVKHLKKVKSGSGNGKDDLYESAISDMIASGAKLKAVDYDGYWQAIKYPWHVQEVFKYLFNLNVPADKGRISETAQIAKNAIIDGDVVIDDNARIMDGAIIKGPCYIGKGTIVAMNSLVRESNVGEKCVIGFSSEVARSYLGDNVWTHSNYIGDSVIGNDVSFGAGTVVGNLRLDEGIISVNVENGDRPKKVSTGTNKWGIVTGDRIRVGVNASFMPGVKIGSGSYIGAGIVVGQDIPENSFVKGEVKLNITENKGSFSEEMREMMRKKL